MDIDEKLPPQPGLTDRETALDSALAAQTPKNSVVVDTTKPTKWVDRVVLVPLLSDAEDYGRQFKWFMTLLVAAGSMLDPIGPSIFWREFRWRSY